MWEAGPLTCGRLHVVSDISRNQASGHKKRDKEKLRSEKQQSVASCMRPDPELNSPPRYLPRLGIQSNPQALGVETMLQPTELMAKALVFLRVCFN